jgi:protein-S-isoprenylcysteine O-methyltransferase Ste14
MHYACRQIVMALISHLIIAGCWLVFCIYWLASALTVKAVAERKTFGSSLAYRIPVILGSVLLWGPDLNGPLSFVLTPHTNLMEFAGAMVCGSGLFISLWARWTLAGNWSSTVTFKKDHELVRTGPYRFVRHPIYTGMLLMCVAVALEYGRLRCWIGVIVWGIGFWIKLRQEELLMLQHFPDEYPVYRRQVKALVPFVI